MSYIPLSLRPFDVNIDTSSTVNYTYTNLDDDLATIKTVGYLSKTVEDTANIANSLKVNDLVYITGSDGSQQVKVTDIDPEITLNAGLIFIDGFIATTTNGVAIESFAAPNTLIGDTILATMDTSVLLVSVREATVLVNGFIQVTFSANAQIGDTVNLLSIRQA